MSEVAKLKMELEEAEKRIRQLEARKPRWIKKVPEEEADVPVGWWIAYSVRVTGAADRSINNKIFDLWLPSEARFENAAANDRK